MQPVKTPSALSGNKYHCNSDDEDSLVENSQALSITDPVQGTDTGGINLAVSENLNNSNTDHGEIGPLGLVADLQNWATKPIKCEQSAYSFDTDDVEVMSIDTFTLARSRACSTITNLELRSISSFGDERRKSMHGSLGSVADIERCDSFSVIASHHSQNTGSQDTIADAASLPSLGQVTDDEDFDEGGTEITDTNKQHMKPFGNVTEDGIETNKSEKQTPGNAHCAEIGIEKTTGWKQNSKAYLFSKKEVVEDSDGIDRESSETRVPSSQGSTGTVVAVHPMECSNGEIVQDDAHEESTEL